MSSYLDSLLNGTAAYPVINSERYRVTFTGVVFDGTTELPLTDTDEGPTVRITWWDGERNYLVAELICFSVFNLAVPVQQWHDVTVTYKDENPQNVAAANLVLYFKKPIPCLQYPGYFYIPGLSTFGCNHKGEVISLIRGVQVPVQLSTESLEGHKYRFYSLRADTSTPKSISRHLCMMISLQPYPRNYLSLEVNHKNLVPGDDRLDNLEWVTKGENISHGMQLRKSLGKFLGGAKIRTYQVRNVDTDNVEVFVGQEAIRTKYGLTTSALKDLVKTGNIDSKKRIQVRIQSTLPWPEGKEKRVTKRIQVRDTTTGNVTTYLNAALAGAVYGLSNDGVRGRADQGPHVLWAGNLQFKYEDDTRPWIPPNGEFKTGGFITVGVQVKDVFTGAVNDYRTSAEAAAAIGVGSPAMCSYVRTNGSTVCNNRYQIRRLDKDTPVEWPIIDVQAELKNKLSKAVLVRDVHTGKIHRFETQADCARSVGVNITTLAERLRRGNPERQFDGLQFKTEDQQASW